MAASESEQNAAARLVDTIEAAGNASLEAVRKFADTVDGVFPHLGSDEGPRRKIIDSAFKMTEQLVSTSARLAQRILDVAKQEPSESDQKSTSSTK
jgi:hypothetical protein